ncbi:MAG: hypothetical protein LBL62_03685, partial [Planctomycetaceae bacterium]|nr:hypothetical protein [Planctomycetaceae bacterium]
MSWIRVVTSRLTWSFQPSFFRAVFACGYFALGVLLFFVFTNGSVLAMDTVEVKNFDGETVFQLKFFAPADGVFTFEQDSAGNIVERNSTRNFTGAQRDAITEAAQYWTDVLKPNGTMPGYVGGLDDNGNPITLTFGQPVIINVGTVSIDNAFGDTLDPIPSTLSDDPYKVAASTALLADGVYVDPALMTKTIFDDVTVSVPAHGVFSLGTGYQTSSISPSQVGRVSSDITTVAIHEFGHILGIASTMEVDYIDDERFAVMYKFPQELTRWQSRLRDNNGNPSVPGAYPIVAG